MSQFKGYKVHLVLQSGEDVEGEIFNAMDKYIELKTDSSTLKLKGSEIKDLEVLELAPKKTRDRRNKKNKQKQQQQQQQPSKATPELKKPELKEFDFAANLKKFDKQSVFAELERQQLEQNGGVPVKKEQVNIGIDEMIVPHDNNLVNTSSLKSNGGAEPRSNSQQQNSKFGQFIVEGSEKVVQTFSTLKLSQILDYARTNAGIPSSSFYETAATNLSLLISTSIVDTNIETPLVVHFVGNNLNGAISLVAARHLLNKGFKVVIYYYNVSNGADDEDNDDIKEDIKIELNRFKSLDGVIVEDLIALKNHLDQLSVNINLIVDSLQDEYTDLTDISEAETVELTSIIEYINKYSAINLSLAAPTGINMSSGVTDLEGGAVFSSHVVSVGVVLASLVNMYKFGSPSARAQHWLIDADFPRTLRAKGNLRKYENVSFRSSNVLKLKFLE